MKNCPNCDADLTKPFSLSADVSIIGTNDAMINEKGELVESEGGSVDVDWDTTEFTGTVRCEECDTIFDFNTGIIK